MSTIGSRAPALLRRAFFVFYPALPGLLLFAAVAFAGAPPSRLPELSQIGKPDAAEAARLIEQFRNAGIPGDYYLEFELRALPRRGRGPTFKGRWWGSRNDEGALTRIELTDASGVAHRLLLQNGERARVWRLSGNSGADARPIEVGIADLIAPLIPGVEISAFDLQMPYLYWPEPSVEKITRVLGRPANAFLFSPPVAFKAQHPEISAVRAYLDTQFNALVQTEILGPDRKITRTLALLGFKTVDGQTIPKSADYRNEITRDKTRLQIVGAALALTLPRSVFDPATLVRPASPPTAGSVVRIDP